MTQPVLARNVLRLESIEQLIDEMRGDAEFQAYIKAAPWYKQYGYDEAERKAASYAFDLTSALQDDMETG